MSSVHQTNIFTRASTSANSSSSGMSSDTRPSVHSASPMKKFKKKIFNGFIQTEKLDDSANNSSSGKNLECYAPLNVTNAANDDLTATDVTEGVSKTITSSNSKGAARGDATTGADSLKPLSSANKGRSAQNVTNGLNVCSKAEANLVPKLSTSSNEREERPTKLISCSITSNTSTGNTSTNLESGINNIGALNVTSFNRSIDYCSLSDSSGAKVEKQKSGEFSPLDGDDSDRNFNSGCSKTKTFPLYSPHRSSSESGGKYVCSLERSREKNSAGASKRISVRKAVVHRYSTFDNRSNPFIHNLVYSESKNISVDNLSTNSSTSALSERPAKTSPFASAATEATAKRQGDTFPRYYPDKGYSQNKLGEPKHFTDAGYNDNNIISNTSISSNTDNGRISLTATSSREDAEAADLSKYFGENVELRNKRSAGNGKLIKSVSLTPIRRLHNPHFPSNGGKNEDFNEVVGLFSDNRTATCSLTRSAYHNTTLAASLTRLPLEKNLDVLNTTPVPLEHGAKNAGEYVKVGKYSFRDTTSLRSSLCSTQSDDERNNFPSLTAAAAAKGERTTNSSPTEQCEIVLPSQLPSTAAAQNGRVTLQHDENIQQQRLYLAESYSSKNTRESRTKKENAGLHKLSIHTVLQNGEKGFLAEQVQPKYKDASTNTEISLISYVSPNSENDDNSDNNNLTNSTQNVSNYDEPISPSGTRYKKFAKPSTPEKKFDIKESPCEETAFSNSFTTGYQRLSFRQRRDWSTTRRHCPRERPRSFNEYLLSQESLYHPFTKSQRRARIYSSINTNKGVSPNLSRYELSSRASSTDRYLDANTRLGFPAPDSSTKHDNAGRGDLNGSQSFFSASEGSLFGDHPATATTTNTTEPTAIDSSSSRHNLSDTRTYRIPLKSDDDDDKTETFCDSSFSHVGENQKLTRSRCNSSDLLDKNSTPSCKRDNLLQASSSISDRKNHKYHKSECNLIEDCRCRSIPSFKSVERTRSSKDVCGKHSMHNNSYHLLTPLPKSKSSSGSIFLKQTVEPSKAFVYLTSIDSLDDVAEQSSSQDPLGSFNSGSQTSKRTYEPLCQNCGLKGHSILKCDKISRVDKLYDVVMLGDRVSITHNEPNYVKSQKNKLPRCYYCGLKGHPSKSCNRLPAHIRQEIDPISTSPKETTFSAYTLPRANRRARSEGRPTPTFSTAPRGHCTNIVDYTDLLSPNSLATDIGLKQSDAFCSDVEICPGAGSDTRSLRPISMYDGVTSRNIGLLEGHPGQQYHHGSLTKRKIKTLKIDSDPRISGAQETFQRRKTFDFDDRDSGIGYGESSSQSNLDNFPRGLQVQNDPSGEIFPLCDFATAEVKGETSKNETDSPTAEGRKKSLKKSASGNGGKKTFEKKKKTNFLRKIACMTGRYSPQPKDQKE